MSKTQKKLQQLLSAGLFIVVIVLLGVLSNRYTVELDWTAGHRNSLSAASIKQLAQMKDPIKVLAFMYPEAEGRSDIKNWVGRYQRHKDNIELEFIDPSTQPLKVKEYNVDHQGELIVEYQGRRETLEQLSEPALTGALQRLTYTGDRFVVFLQGHGEHPIESASGNSDASYAKFVAQLADKGLKSIPLNLAKTPQVPENAAALVIASPRSSLLDGEIKIIDDYVKAGGNLLWLTDPDSPTGLDAVAKTLGISWQNGYAIFPNYQALQTGSPEIYLATGYPRGNPVTGQLGEVTAFPGVRSLAWSKDSGWKTEPMLITDDSAWLETGPIDKGPISFDDKAGDIEGPLNIGATLTRETGATKADEAAADKAAPAPDKATGHTQRVALVGDSDFLTNANLGVLGNHTLAINLMQWLVARDDQLNIDIPKAPDAALYLPGWAMLALAALFVILLPLGLIGYGVARWAIRRRS